MRLLNPVSPHICNTAWLTFKLREQCVNAVFRSAVWAFTAAAHSPGVSALYHRRHEHGDRHAAALRNVFKKLIDCLYHCL